MNHWTESSDFVKKKKKKKANSWDTTGQSSTGETSPGEATVSSLEGGPVQTHVDSSNWDQNKHSTLHTLWNEKKKKSSLKVDLQQPLLTRVRTKQCHFCDSKSLQWIRFNLSCIEGCVYTPFVMFSLVGPNPGVVALLAGLLENVVSTIQWSKNTGIYKPRNDVASCRDKHINTSKQRGLISCTHSMD